LTFFLLVLIVTFTGIVSWLTIYNIATAPGPKFLNGIICGFAEAFASLFSGLLLKWMSDTNATKLMAAICLFFNIIYKYVSY
jgi:hypothetical protein